MRVGVALRVVRECAPGARKKGEKLGEEEVEVGVSEEREKAGKTGQEIWPTTMYEQAQLGGTDVASGQVPPPCLYIVVVTATSTSPRQVTASHRRGQREGRGQGGEARKANAIGSTRTVSALRVHSRQTPSRPASLWMAMPLEI